MSRNLMKKLTFFTALVIFVIAMSISVYAETKTYGDFTYTEDESGITITGYNKNTGKLSIPESINGKDVIAIGDKAFYEKEGLTGDLVIPSKVTTIGNYAFAYCDGFKGKLVIPYGVTSIGNNCFFHCSYLTGDLVIPDSVSSLGESAFMHCYGLSGKLVLSKNITTIKSNTFGYCRSLSGSLVIPSGVTKIELYAFNGCNGLSGNLNIPSGLSEIESGAFEGCNGLTGITVDPGNVEYTSIADGKECNCVLRKYNNGTYTLIAGCNSSTIPEGVTLIWSEALAGFTGLTGPLTIPSSVTTIRSRAFAECTGLSGELIIPDAVTEINSHAFNKCSNLTGVVRIPSGLTTLGDVSGTNPFTGCSGIEGIVVDEGNANYRSKIDGKECNGIFSADGKSIIVGCQNTKIPNGVTSIEAAAFQGCSTLSGIDIPSSVTSIEKYAFYECTGLRKIDIPSSVRSLGDSAFNRCQSLSDVEIPSSVTSIGELTFCLCTGLSSIKIPSSVTTIGDGALNFCQKLTTVSNNSSASIALPDSDSTIRPWKNKDTGEKITSIANGTAVRDPLPDPEPEHVHSLKHYDRVEPTVDKEGNIEYWECAGCNSYFSDEDGKTKISLDDIVIPKLKKIVAASTGFCGDYDGKAHGITVTVTDPSSGATVNYGSAEGNYDKDASPEYTEVGIYTVYFRITAPGYKTLTGSDTVEIKKVEPAPAPDHKHTLTHFERKEATETEDGHIEYWECTGCGKLFKDEVCTEEITLAETVIPKKQKEGQKEEPEDDPKKDPKEGSEEESKEEPKVEPKAEAVITPSDNKAMDVRAETVGEYQVTYAHQIPFPGKGKLTAESFGENFTVKHGDSTYKVKKIKVNKKKKKIQITGLEGAPKDVEKAVKKATKGDKGIPYTQNPYYVKDGDNVKPKFKKSGGLSSLKVAINGKDYKAKKNEFEYIESLNVIRFSGENLAGSWTVNAK